jgi:aldehyde:ferredoxin oxidoreductase
MPAADFRLLCRWLNTRLFGNGSANNPAATDSKPHMVCCEENQKATTNWSYAMLRPDKAEYLNAVTGLDFTEEEFQEIGGRFVNLERTYRHSPMFCTCKDIVAENFLKETTPRGVD